MIWPHNENLATSYVNETNQPGGQPVAVPGIPASGPDNNHPLTVQEDRQPWFSPDGRLLPSRYGFMEAQVDAMVRAGIPELAEFPHRAPQEERIGWARARDWEISAMYQRCSGKQQDSYAGQVAECIDMALRKRIMVFPELTFGDEGIGGRDNERPGILRLRQAIEKKRIDTIVTFSISRWFRSLPLGLLFIRHEVVESGIRAVAKAENFDTRDSSWSDFLTLNLFVAEKMVAGQSAFVRMGHRSRFEAGQIVGTCPVGFYPKEVPGAGLTKQKKPITRQAIHPRVAALILRHFEMIDSDIDFTLAEGCRLWNAETSTWPPEDRKYSVSSNAKSLFLTEHAYKRMLRREDYINRQAYGETRRQWQGKKNRFVQMKSAPGEALYRKGEDPPTVPADLFYRVQVRLDSLKVGERGPRKDKEPPLESLLTGLYFCAKCGHVFYQYGRQYMNCPDSRLGPCGNWGTVSRKGALQILVATLREQVLAAPELAEKIIAMSCEIDARIDTDSATAELAEVERLIKREDNVLDLLEERLRDDPNDDEVKRRYKAALAAKNRLCARREALKCQAKQVRQPLTRERVAEILARFDEMLANAGDGKLGAESRHQAAALIKILVGGRITVTFDRLHGVRRAWGRGRFAPAIMGAIRQPSDVNTGVDINLPEIDLSFRELPRYARIADEVYRLYHQEEPMTMTEIGKRFGTNSGNVWLAYKFWHESRGLPVPMKRPGVQAKHNRSA